MSVEVIDSNLESSGSFDEGTKEQNGKDTIDARRRVEDKIEEIRLLKETQEYSFDF